MRNWTVSLLVLASLSGCGPSAEILEKQDEKEAIVIEEQIVDPPGMSESDKAARRRRIELQYGPEAAKKYDEKNSDQSSE